MTCDEVEQEILTGEDLTERAQGHLARCPACSALAARVFAVDQLIRRLPVPSTLRKEEFLSSLRNPFSDLKPIPARPVPAQVFWTPWRAGSLAGLAAALLMAVVFTSSWKARRMNDDVDAIASKHELLDRSVKDFVALTQPAPDRLTHWSQTALTFRDEAIALHKAAGSEEMNWLADAYEKSLVEGVLEQAGRETKSADRFVTVIKQLEETEATTEQLAATAPPQSQAALKKIARIAREGRNRIRSIS